MSGMFTKAELKVLRGRVTRLLNNSTITRGEATQLRDLIDNSPVRARYLINQKMTGTSKH